MILRQRWFLDATVPSKEQLHPDSAYNASFWEASSEEEPFNLLNGQRGNFVTLYPLLRKKVCRVSTGFLASLPTATNPDSWNHVHVLSAFVPSAFIQGSEAQGLRVRFFWEEKPILFASLETSFCTLILNFLQKSPSSGFGSWMHSGCCWRLNVSMVPSYMGSYVFSHLGAKFWRKTHGFRRFCGLGK